MALDDFDVLLIGVICEARSRTVPSIAALPSLSKCGETYQGIRSTP